MTPDPAIATAADYADAMIVARRAKHVLALSILLLLLIQLTIFFLVRFDVLSVSSTSPTTAPATAPATQPDSISRVPHYVASGCLFLGVACSILLGLVLLLITNIMLVGRLIGVARVTSAYLWTLVLMLLLFPWQSFLDNSGLSIEQAPWKWPGVLYSWGELMDPKVGAHFEGALDVNILRWARYVVLPLVAMLIVLIIQSRSNRGIRQALGEEATTTPESNA